MTPSSNEETNREVLRGLMVLDGLLWLGIFAALFRYKTVDNTLVLAASSVLSGLIGWVSRGEPRHNSGSSVTAPDATNVTVNNTPADTQESDTTK